MSGLGAEIGQRRSVAVYHDRSSTKLWKLDASIITGNHSWTMDNLNDFAGGCTIVYGLGSGASSYVSVFLRHCCISLACDTWESHHEEGMGDRRRHPPATAARTNVRTVFMLSKSSRD